MNQTLKATLGALAVIALGTSASSAAEFYKAPEDGGPRLLEVTGVKRAVNMRSEASVSAAVVARILLGARLSNLGCKSKNSGVWCDVQPVGGGPRGFVSSEFLKPAVGPDGAVAMGYDDSSLRLGQGKFDAEGPLPCASKEDQPMTECHFKVARSTGGYAAIAITHPGGLTRVIYFADGQPIGFSSSEAEGSSGYDLKKEKKGDLNLIGVGPERYEIPDAVPLGG
jgi:hypothetical protein